MRQIHARSFVAHVRKSILLRQVTIPTAIWTVPRRLVGWSESVLSGKVLQPRSILLKLLDMRGTVCGNVPDHHNIWRSCNGRTTREPYEFPTPVSEWIRSPISRTLHFSILGY